MEDTCVVCSLNSASYKCPKCRIKYCSITCYKTHKESDKCLEEKCDTNEEKSSDYNYITSDTIPVEKLQRLEQSSQLKQILANPHVRDILLDIDRSQNVSEMMDLAMKEPIFVEFADVCLKLVEK